MSLAMSALEGINLEGLEVIQGEGDKDSVAVFGGGRVLVVEHTIPKRIGAHPWRWLIGDVDAVTATESMYVHTDAQVREAIEPLINAMRRAEG